MNLITISGFKLTLEQFIKLRNLKRETSNESDGEGNESDDEGDEENDFNDDCYSSVQEYYMPFLNNQIIKYVYIKHPYGFSKSGEVYRLLKGLYGLK